MRAFGRRITNRGIAIFNLANARSRGAGVGGWLIRGAALHNRTVTTVRVAATFSYARHVPLHLIQPPLPMRYVLARSMEMKNIPMQKSKLKNARREHARKLPRRMCPGSLQFAQTCMRKVVTSGRRERRGRRGRQYVRTFEMGRASFTLLWGYDGNVKASRAYPLHSILMNEHYSFQGEAVLHTERM